MKTIGRFKWQGGLALLTAATMTALVLLALAVVRDAGASGPVAGASASKSVDINHFAFHPPTLTVNKGARVSFANTSGVTHTATGKNFDTKRIKPGTSVVVRFTQKGTFAYHCKIHPFMKGKIVVQ